MQSGHIMLLIPCAYQSAFREPFGPVVLLRHCRAAAGVRAGRAIMRAKGGPAQGRAQL